MTKVHNDIKWTHWFEPPMIPGYAEKCIILEERNNIIGKLFGDVRILTHLNYVGWEFKKNLLKFFTEDY